MRGGDGWCCARWSSQIPPLDLLNTRAFPYGAQWRALVKFEYN